MTALAVAAGALGWWQASRVAGARSHLKVGLFTTLPILWQETSELSELLADDAPPHWAAKVLSEAGRLRPLDTLAPDQKRAPLVGVDLLIMAQPRPLFPDENLALDTWVRDGGRVLLFADPMLTAASTFPLGDKRRPQPVVLLSPILERWGLRLSFDDAQPAGTRAIALWGATVPVRMAGALSPIGAGHRCRFAGQGLVAQCRIGRGNVLVLADAAMLEDRADSERAATLRRLVTLAGP